MIFFDTCTVGRILNRFSSDMYTVDDSLPFILNILLAQFFGLVGKFWIYIKYLDLFILQLYKRVKQAKEMRDKEIVQMHKRNSSEYWNDKRRTLFDLEKMVG